MRMKKFAFISLLSLTLVGCGGRSNYYGSEYSDDTAYMGEQDYDSTENNQEIQRKLDEIKNLPELQNYKALYEAVDKNGKTLNIYITKENSAVVTTSDAEILYCTFNDYKDNPYIEYDYDISPSEGEISIYFEGGKGETKSYIPLIIKDNWVYLATDKAKANNPNWRLPITLKSGSTEKPKKEKTAKKESKQKEDVSEQRVKQSEGPSESEIVAMETMMYGYNEAAWRAKARKDARNK